MLKVLVCACLLAVRINASGPDEQLHQPVPSLARSSGQLDAIPQPGGGEDQSPKPSDRTIHPQRPTDRNNTSSRAGPSTFTNRNIKWVPKHRELPTRAPSPLPPKRHNSSRTREPRDARNDRRYERRSPGNNTGSSRHRRGRSSPVTLVSIEIPSKSHHRDRHSSRKHNHRLCTIRIQEEDGHISVHIHNRSNRVRSHTHRSKDYSPVGRSSDDSSRRGNLSPFDRNSSRDRSYSPVDRGNDTDRSYLYRRPSPIRRERSSRRRDSEYSPRGRNRSSKHGYSSRGRNYSPIGRGDDTDGSYLERRQSPGRRQRDPSPRRGYSPRGRNYSPIGRGDDSDERRVGRRPSPVRSQSPHSPRRVRGNNHPREYSPSTWDKTKLAKIVDEEDFATFKELCKMVWFPCIEGIEYLIETKNPDAIANFIQQAELVNHQTLAAIYRKGSKAIIDKVMSEINFPQEVVINAAKYPDLMCLPEKVIHLLGRIETLEGQECAITHGIRDLFWKDRTYCIDPLLNALKGKNFLGRDLRNIVIQKTFVSGAMNYSEIWTKGFHDHHATTPAVYADALGLAGRSGVNNLVFKWLLATASHDDLLAVKANQHYAKTGANFRSAIEQALSSAKPGKTRVAVNGPKAEAVKQIVSEIASTSPEKGFVDIICSYVIEDIGKYRNWRNEYE